MAIDFLRKVRTRSTRTNTWFCFVDVCTLLDVSPASDEILNAYTAMPSKDVHPWKPKGDPQTHTYARPAALLVFLAELPPGGQRREAARRVLRSELREVLSSGRLMKEEWAKPSRHGEQPLRAALREREWTNAEAVRRMHAAAKARGWVPGMPTMPLTPAQLVQVYLGHHLPRPFLVGCLSLVFEGPAAPLFTPGVREAYARKNAGRGDYTPMD